MTPQVGQRWLWITTGMGGQPSKVVFEITSVDGDSEKIYCTYVQVITKGYAKDVVGYQDKIYISTLQHYTGQYIYLEGQDRPQ